MKNIRILPVIVSLSIATFIICLFLNFMEFQGSFAKIKNVIVTFSYITVWIFVLIIAITSRNRGAVKYCSVSAPIVHWTGYVSN